MKGKHVIPSLLILAAPTVYAQQITLEGQVSIHNSQYHTGKIEYVEGAIVSAPFTTTQTTNKKGAFKLGFAGVDGGNAVAVSVEKAGLEAADPIALRGLAIGREAPLRVSLAKKGWLEQAQKELLNNSLKALAARRDALATSLRREGEESRIAILGLEKQLNRKIATRFEGEQILNEQREELARWLPERTEKLVRVNLDFASALFRKAYEHYKQGEMEKAAASLDGPALNKKAEAVLANFRELESKGKSKQAEEAKESVRQVAEEYQLKAQAHLLLFQYQDALDAHQKAASLLEKAGGQEDIPLAEAQAAVALTYLLLGDYKNALHHQQRDVKIKEALLGTAASETASSYNLLALAYQNLEEYQMALEVQKKAVSIKEQALAPGHPDLAVSYAGLAGIYRSMGEHSMALEAQLKALHTQERALPPNHPDIGRSYNAIAEIHLAGKTHEKALEAQLKALFIQERALALNHPDIARSYNNLALIYLNLGKFENALAIQQKILATQEQALPASHPDIATSFHNLASTFYFLKDLDSALQHEHRAYAILKEQLPPYHPQIKAVESSFAFLYTTRGERRQAAGQYQEAIADLRQALEFHPDNPDARKRIKQMEAGQARRQADQQEALAMNQKGTARSAPAPQRGSRLEPKKEAAPQPLGIFQATQETSLRERPTSSSKVLRRLSAGDKLQLIEKTEYHWWKVMDKGRVGYVKALLMEKVE